MKLLEYLNVNQISDEQFAVVVGASPFAVRKWKYRERTPRGAMLVRIKEATNGAVTADDFLPAPEREEA